MSTREEIKSATKQICSLSVVFGLYTIWSSYHCIDVKYLETQRKGSFFNLLLLSNTWTLCALQKLLEESDTIEGQYTGAVSLWRLCQFWKSGPKSAISSRKNFREIVTWRSVLDTSGNTDKNFSHRKHHSDTPDIARFWRKYLLTNIFNKYIEIKKVTLYENSMEIYFKWAATPPQIQAVWKFLCPLFLNRSRTRHHLAYKW